MNSSKSLARKIRTLSRERLRVSKTLWNEYKRIRRSGLRRIRQHLGLIGLIYLAAILGVFVRHSGRKAPLLLLALYCAASVLGRANALSDALYRSGDLAFFMHAPATDVQFFEYEWRRFLKSSLWVWFYSLLAFGYLALTLSPGRIGWVAAVTAATLQWLLVVSLVVIVELLVPAWLKMRIALPLYVLTFGVIFFPASLVSSTWRASLPLPTAWIPYIFEHGVLNHESENLYFLVPILLFLSFLPLTARRLRGNYPIAELTYPFASSAAIDRQEYDEQTGQLREEDWRGTSIPESSSLSVTPLHLRGLDWNSSGWIEGLAGRMLSEREKKSADFLCGGRLGLWSAQWRRGLKGAGIGVVALLLPRLFPAWISVVIGVLASMFALPLIGGRWEGVQLVADSGKVRPAFASVPLSYTDISRVIAKINLVRYAAWFPISLAYAAILAWRSQIAPSLGIEVAAEIILVLISFQPILIAGLHSYGTNDTRSLNLHSFFAILGIGSVGIVYGVCWIIFFTAAEWAPKGVRAIPAAATGAFLCSLLIWRCYKLFYDRGRLDTMRVPD